MKEEEFFSRNKKLKEAALPLIKLLNEDYDPHFTAIVTNTGVELLEGAHSIRGVTESNLFRLFPK